MTNDCRKLGGRPSDQDPTVRGPMHGLGTYFEVTGFAVLGKCLVPLGIG